MRVLRLRGLRLLLVCVLICILARIFGLILAEASALAIALAAMQIGQRSSARPWS